MVIDAHEVSKAWVVRFGLLALAILLLAASLINSDCAFLVASAT